VLMIFTWFFLESHVITLLPIQFLFLNYKLVFIFLVTVEDIQKD